MVKACFATMRLPHSLDTFISEPHEVYVYSIVTTPLNICPSIHLVNLDTDTQYSHLLIPR